MVSSVMGGTGDRGEGVAMIVGQDRAQLDTLRDRLIEAADAELAEHGSLTGRFEAVAHRAGVSRATAYRQLGSVSELLTRVAVRRSKKYIACLREVMEREQGALNKVEAAMIYGARVLPDEPIVLNLISRQFSSVIDPEVFVLIKDLMGPTLEEGRLSGEIRTDVHVEFVIDYLVEQSYFATRVPDRSERAVRQRFRTFIEPAIGRQ
jgi:AcrR family transcriptional regulator